jgi:hypothetical protein
MKNQLEEESITNQLWTIYIIGTVFVRKFGFIYKDQ